MIDRRSTRDPVRRLPGIALGLLVVVMTVAGCSARGDRVVWSATQERWEEPGRNAPASNEIVAPDAWISERAGMVVRLKTSPGLNRYRGEPNALLVKLLQVNDPSTAAELLGNTVALRRLLSVDEANPALLAQARYVLEPGSERVVLVDRVPLARYLVIVTGYSTGDVAASSRLVPIPGLRDYPKGWALLRPDNLLNRVNPWADLPPARPGRMEIAIHLGDDRIEKIEAVAR